MLPVVRKQYQRDGQINQYCESYIQNEYAKPIPFHASKARQHSGDQPISTFSPGVSRT